MKLHELVTEVANALAEKLKSYELPATCSRYGLADGDEDEAFHSKRLYVKRRLEGWSLPKVANIARLIVDEYGDENLEKLLARLGARGVQGEFRNLIFAANGPKPTIILSDAVNNIIRIVKNEEFCLVYDEPLKQHGLSWRELVSWWASKTGKNPDDLGTVKSLFERLSLSLSSPPERILFNAYCRLYRMPGGWDLPALIPQVYLHYSPYTKRWIQQHGEGEEIRQRMDFLLLFPHQVRIVIEVDGIQHYSSSDGQADTRLYAEMVAEDRRLRLSGYDVYRFGGAELTPTKRQHGTNLPEIQRSLREFFLELLNRHEVPFDYAPKG